MFRFNGRDNVYLGRRSRYFICFGKFLLEVCGLGRGGGKLGLRGREGRGI